MKRKTKQKWTKAMFYYGLTVLAFWLTGCKTTRLQSIATENVSAKKSYADLSTDWVEVEKREELDLAGSNRSYLMQLLYDRRLYLEQLEVEYDTDKSALPETDTPPIKKVSSLRVSEMEKSDQLLYGEVMDVMFRYKQETDSMLAVIRDRMKFEEKTVNSLQKRDTRITQTHVWIVLGAVALLLVAGGIVIRRLRR
jgi:hypothetical protein